jgi:two-component system CheB/CheR fusion protein
VLGILLNNAGKFTPAGGQIRISLEREPARERSASGFAVLRVRDNGRGIDPAVLPKIFELFVQESRPSRSGGIGLGLTLARRLVELHGGAIEAHSAGPGMGSEFTVRLPLYDGAADAAVPGHATARVTPRHVLIVDDNRDVAWSLRLMLRMDGHEVEVVHQGAEAVAAAKRMRADAVLLDIGLPDMDGYAVARALRDDPDTRDVLIVATTGYARAQDREMSLRAGVDEHLGKPVDMDRLAEIVVRGRRPGANAPR